MRRSTVQNSAVMMDSPILDGSDKDMEAAYSVRGGILFTQAAIVLLAGLLLPIPPVAVDVLLSINLVFTAMLLFVVVFAREPAEITSVPLVVIFVTLLRLGTNVAAAKSILLIADGGRIINWCGTRIYYGFISVVIAVILVFLVCVLICRAANFIRRKAVSYLVETIPSRRVTLQTEFQTGVLTYQQMLRAKNRIEKQTKFFAGMASTSSLLLCDGVIALIITLATIFGATAMGIMNASSIIAGPQQYSPLSLAIALTTAIPAGLVALGLQLLINKRFLITLKVQTPMAQAIHVASRPVPKDDIPAAVYTSPSMSESVESEPPSEQVQTTVAEFVDPLQTAQEQLDDTAAAALIPDIAPTEEPDISEMPDELLDTEIPMSESTDIDQTRQAPQEAEIASLEEQPVPSQIAGDDYNAASLQQEPTIEIQEPAAAPQMLRDDYYYDSILATIGDKRKASLLLAAGTVSDLPVTVAVELVIRIIQLRKKCLLIDMDPRRNAVATAFDVDSDSMQGKAASTGIDNLWISPADNPENPAAVTLERKVANALRVFHYVVIYAPNAAAQNIQQQLVGVPDTAVIFAANKSPDELRQLAETLASSGCRVIPEQEFFKSPSASRQ